MEIPAEKLVGELHGGWRVLMTTLDYERVTSEKVGTVMWLLDALAPRGRRASRAPSAQPAARRRPGGPPPRPPCGASCCEAGQPASAQSSMAKLSVAELMQHVAAFAVELLGPEGLLEEGSATLGGRVAAFQRAAVATTISGGAAEIQRTVIARRGLGVCHRDAGRLPAASGIRVLEYAQYVAGPFAGMVLADLGADVIKVEPPAGDAWRRYEPFAEGREPLLLRAEPQQALGRDRPQDGEGRRANRALIRTADVVLHNLPPDRARRFELDRESVSEVNPGGGLVLRVGAGQRRARTRP